MTSHVFVRPFKAGDLQKHVIFLLEDTDDLQLVIWR